MKKLLKLTTVSLVMLLGTNFTAKADCLVNASAVIAYVQGASQNTNFLTLAKNTPLDQCVYGAFIDEAFAVSGLSPSDMNNGQSNANSLKLDNTLLNAANWPAQNKLSLASCINGVSCRNGQAPCGSPYTQFNSNSQIFTNFIKTYVNAIQTMHYPCLPN